MQLKKFIKYSVRYPLELLGTLLLWGMIRILPMRVASAFVGKALVALMPWMIVARETKRRIRNAFPEISEQQCHAIAKQAFENFGRTLAEMMHLDRVNLNDQDRFECEGLQYLDEAIVSKKPTIFVSAHYGNWEILGLYARFRGGVSRQIYRPPNNPWVDRFLRRLRKPIDPHPIPKGKASLKASIKALQQGCLLCLLIDQKLNEGIDVPFLGMSAPTTTLPAVLAYRLKANIVTARCIRKPKGKFKVIIDPPIQIDTDLNPTIGVYQLTLRLNQILESWVVEDPGQWFWLHKRWRDPT